MTLKAKLSISITLFIICLPVLSFSTQIKVGVNQGFIAIQNAVNKAKAGDIISIQAGTYKSDIPLEIASKKNITITSTGIAKLLCTSTVSNVIEILNSSAIKVENIHATHVPTAGRCAGYVISIIRSANITITGCDINGCGVVGVFTNYSKNILLKNNTIHNNSTYGIYACYNKTMTITNNKIVNNKSKGAFFYVCTNVNIISNIFKDNKSGNLSLIGSRAVKCQGNSPDKVNSFDGTGNTQNRRQQNRNNNNRWRQQNNNDDDDHWN